MASPIAVRRDLLDAAPYVSPQRPARYRMNTNESPYPPPPALVQEIGRSIEELALNRYPDRDASALYSALAEHNGWTSQGLWVANGSNEVFMHLFLAFGGPGRRALTFEPTYPLHSLIPRIAGTEVRQSGRDDGFEIDLDLATKELRDVRPDIVIVCSPNNPTGGCEPLATVQTLLEEAPGIVVVDEAYIEFASPQESVRTLLDSYDNLVITKSFSKAWRLAGARLGYMLAAPELIAELARVRLPYHLSAITQLIGEAAMRHSDETLKFVRALVEQRDRIAIELQVQGIRSYPSRANFVLFEIEDTAKVWEQLLSNDVLVRSYPGVHRLDGCLRVTAGLPEETDAFLNAIEDALDG